MFQFGGLELVFGELSPPKLPVATGPVSFAGKNVSTLGALRMVNCGCCDNILLLCKTCLHAVYHRPMALRIKMLHFVLIGKWQPQNGINKSSVHLMDCACLVHKISGYCYYKKGVYVLVIRSTAKRYFRGREHGPALQCIYPKNKPTKNAWNHGYSHERAINSKKRSQCHLFCGRM